MPVHGPTQSTNGVRRVSVSVLNLEPSLVSEAAAGTEAERQLGFLKSLKLYRKACAWSIFFSACIIMEGFDLVLINSLFAYPPFQKQFGYKTKAGNYNLTAAWQSGIANGSYVGQLAGLLLSGWIADRFGYKKTLILSLTATIGIIFIIFFSEHLPQFLIGEMALGIPLGIFQALTNTYASEVCPTHLRAYLTTYVNLCWIIGQFIAADVLKGMLSVHSQWGYKIPFALQWIWPVPLMIGIWLAPESPWWLVRKGRLEEAKHSLERLTTRNSKVDFKPNETIAMMIQTNALEKEMNDGTSYFDLFKGHNLRRTEIVSMTWLVHAFCGASLIGFSTFFYEQAGMNVSNAFSMSLGQHGIGAVGTIFSWFLMSRVGRRFLYLYGFFALFIILFAIGCASLAGKSNIAAQWAIGSLLLVYTLVYDSTVGPVRYSLVTELCSTRLRTKSVVFARSVYIIGSIITNILTPRMLNPDAWNWGAKSGFFFAGTCLLCIIWIYFRLPEPAGRTYGDIDILFEEKVPARQFHKAIVVTPKAEPEKTAGKEKAMNGHSENISSQQSA